MKDGYLKQEVLNKLMTICLGSTAVYFIHTALHRCCCMRQARATITKVENHFVLVRYGFVFSHIFFGYIFTHSTNYTGWALNMTCQERFITLCCRFFLKEVFYYESFSLKNCSGRGRMALNERRFAKIETFRFFRNIRLFHRPFILDFWIKDNCCVSGRRESTRKGLRLEVV